MLSESGRGVSKLLGWSLRVSVGMWEEGRGTRPLEN